MQPTRRYWELIGVAIALVVGAILFDRPVLIGGAAVIFGWLVASQVAFVSALDELDDSLTAEQSLPQTATTIDEPIPFTLSTEGDAVWLDVTVSARPSAGLEMDGTATVQLGDTTVTAIKSPIAGTHTLETPEVTITDTRGVFTEQLTRGHARELTVQPREPKRIHIGEGGDALPIAFGEHTIETGGSGLIPAEIREYTGQEFISRIDWKATARLATPHVRDFEAESDITTILVVDRRGRLDIGPAGETAFEYLRSGALSYLSAIESLDDPIGCFLVDNEGVEQAVTPTSSMHGYESVRRPLHTTCVDTETQTQRRRRKASLNHRAPMFDRETAFGRTLASYTSAASTVPSTDPLTAAIRRAATTHQGTVQLAVFTDDSDHAELRNVATEAKRANVRLSVFIAPQSLYESETALNDTVLKESYREFEQFRRQLAAIDKVTAYEVAPRERIERALETQRLHKSS
jgi:uncharacterized protein (DUF58 family)